MDLGFARRRQLALLADTPDLDSLLSGASARQTMSATARAQAALDARIVRTDTADARIDLFAPDAATPPPAHDACFSRLPPFTRRQPS